MTIFAQLVRRASARFMVCEALILAGIVNLCEKRFDNGRQTQLAFDANQQAGDVIVAACLFCGFHQSRTEFVEG